MMQQTANKWARTFGLILVLAICGKATAAGPDIASHPAIAGTHVRFETNPGTQELTYSGTNETGKYTMVLTSARNGRKSEIKGHYEVTRNNGWWTIKHESNDGNFSLQFEITKKFPEGGFKAKGNVLDRDGHPALHGTSPFDFNFVKAGTTTK